MIRTPERYGQYFWETDGNGLICDQTDEMPSDFPFVLENVNTSGSGGETAIRDIATPTSAWAVKTSPTGIEISTERQVTASVYNLSGNQVMNTTVPSGIHTLDITPLSRGIYIIRISDGQQSQSVKFIR